MDNELITTGDRSEFISEVIKKRGFIRARYATWDEPRNGLITFAGKTMLKVLFQTAVNVATSYYTIKISEVLAGLWEITYTNDLEHFYRIDGGQAIEDVDLETKVRTIFRGGEINGETISDEG